MKKLLISLAIAVFLLSSIRAHAQDEGGFSAQNFQSSPGHDGFLTVEGAAVDRQKIGFRLGAMAVYQYKPLVIRGCNEVVGGECTAWSDEETAIVKHHLMMEAMAALSIGGVFEAGLVVPAVLYQEGDDVAGTATAPGIDAPANVAGLEDIRLHLKLDLLHGVFGYGGDAVSLALVPVVSFPVGNAVSDSSFTGDSFMTFHPKLAFGARAGRVRFGLNGGYLIRKAKEFHLAEVGNRISFGGAMEVSMTDHLSGIVEVFGQNGLTSDATDMPLEADGALRYRFDSGVAITAGAGAGILAGVGSPRVRAFAGLMWAPQNTDKDGDGILNEEDSCPTDPEDADGFEDADGCPDPDNDGDGILDADDSCPTDPEDVDEFEDADGCPDPDNDGDGILDADDSCPADPEDIDEFEDADGCPDPDNDGDGILDADDKCPTDPEDVDEFKDADGCPDPDNDGDGILDADDKCPNEKEVFNGFEDEDGCPDKGKQLVEVKKDKIEINEKIQFKTNSDKIVGVRSFEILDAVFAVLDTSRSMNVRIEGHTDTRGKRKHNMKLSKRRARSVKRYLEKKGIDGGRMEPVGLGPDEPISSNATKDGRADNRRVEFHITDQ